MWQDELKEKFCETKGHYGQEQIVFTNYYATASPEHLIIYIKSLLKKQREICTELKFEDMEYIHLGDRERIRDKIRNTPEPE